ncbi:MAG TPA: glycosyltransferase [Chloroflexota bacterium]|nr:glycosyltransferase [Chloroflexota bacterium]
MTAAPQRIVQVIASSDYGGAEQVLATLLGALAPQRYTCWVVCPPDGPMVAAYARHAADVLALPLGTRDAASVPRLVAWLRALRPDLVHTHLWTADLWGGLAAALAGVRARVATVHGPYFRADAMAGLVRVRRRALARTYRAVYALHHRVIAVSRAVARDLRARPGLPVAADRLRVVYNGLDLARVQAAEPLPRAALGVPAGAPLVVCVGNLFPIKGQRLLISAFARLRQRLPAAHLLLVGEGPDRPALERLAAAHGQQEHVHFLGARADAPAILAASDVVAVPSLAEGLPLVPLEALALGKPVVATRAGGLPEIIAHGVTGLLVPPRRPEALAAALLAVLTQPAYAAALAARGRAQVLARFTPTAMAAGVTRVYAEALHPSSGSPWPP